MSWLSRPFLAIALATASFAAPVQWTTASGGNGNFYDVITNNDLTWDAARQAAIDAGGYLVTITSSQENNFVLSLLQNSFRFAAFIGATDAAVEGTFRWTSGPEAGNALTYTNWLSGFPNGGTAANGTEMRGNPGQLGLWRDVATTGYTSAYIIEFNAAPGGGSSGGGGGAVPEPSTMAIMAGGIGALYFVRKKRA